MSTKAKTTAKGKTATAKKATVKKVKVSAYKLNVLNTNKALKTESKTLGGALKTLWFFRKEINLPTQYQKIVKAAMDDDAIYKAMKKDVRISKAGNYSPFFVLQAIHKSTKK